MLLDQDGTDQAHDESSGGCLDESQVVSFRLALEVPYLTLPALGLEVGDVAGDVLLPSRQHRLYKSGELMGDRLVGAPSVEPSHPRTVAGADVTVVVCGAGRHAERLTCLVEALRLRPP